jgi:hypothetical protein
MFKNYIKRLYHIPRNTDELQYIKLIKNILTT